MKEETFFFIWFTIMFVALATVLIINAG